MFLIFVYDLGFIASNNSFQKIVRFFEKIAKKLKK